MKFKKIDYAILGTIAVIILAGFVTLILAFSKNNILLESPQSSAASSTSSEDSTNNIPIENVTPSSVIESSSKKNTTTSSKTSSTKKPTVSSNSEKSEVVSDIPVQSEEDKSEWFTQIYALAKKTYISELKTEKATLEPQLKTLSEQCEDYYTEKLYAVRKLMEDYANMGLLNSGQYTTALNNLNYKYDSKINELDRQISVFTTRLGEITSEINDPDPNQILAIIAVNNNLTALQVVEYYNKYMY